MRRRIFWAMAAATAALALVAGSGSFGFFSDSTTNPGNLFQAGVLALSNDRDATFILSDLNMQPGDSITRDVELAQAPGSTLDMNYTLTRTDISPSIGGLCDALDIVVTRIDPGATANDVATIPLGQVISPASATLSTFAVAPIDVGALNNSGNPTDTYSFQVTFTDTGAPQNPLQGTACEVAYTWAAQQQTTNDDELELP